MDFSITFDDKVMDDSVLLTKNPVFCLGIIGGTGLDNPDLMEVRKEHTISTPFGPPSDNLISGTINSIQCVLLARHGRKHTISPSNVNYRAKIYAIKKKNRLHTHHSNNFGRLLAREIQTKAVGNYRLIYRQNNKKETNLL